MWPTNFSSQLIEALVEWLWRSWTSLGVSGHGVIARHDRVIDPESLLLASSVWARYDARLFDEILDWLCLHGSLINLQRLRNLHRTGLGDAAVLSAMAAVIQKHSAQTKWKALEVEASGELKPLFLDLDGRTASWGNPDPVFASQGFHRGRLELRVMSGPPSPLRAANLWLKLRCLFGTTTRAEIMLQLLTGGPATASEIAQRSSFTPRSILLSLREMAQSGHVYEPPRPLRTRPARGQATPARTRGPSMAYALQIAEWDFLRTWKEPVGFPELKSSAPLLLLCQQLLAQLESGEPSAAMQSLQNRDAIATSLNELQRQGLSGEYGIPAQLPGDQLVSVMSERLPAATASL